MWAWKKQGEGLSERLVDGTVKFGGGSLVIWSCILWEGPSFACKIESKMDGDLHIKIMEDELKESLAYYNKRVEDVIFQQDMPQAHLHQGQGVLCKARRRLAEYETPPGGMLEL
ncbi:hypothetical protein M408DRAFT_30749 [Serendipita vermifera MAFF 305830]|uniref:Uncharacterized protein n=1 Tax=Serendipita vermifera MAFF 305830 TaxID=933852 RepID=A0A0C2WQT0_SERVB|nr:hypothetical protein M408DRAFT_30749 [Serendipita vermifera MAFF 305830]